MLMLNDMECIIYQIIINSFFSPFRWGGLNYLGKYIKKLLWIISNISQERTTIYLICV